MFRLSDRRLHAHLLFLCLLFAALPLKGEGLRSYLPVLQGANTADLGLALVNPTLAEASVTLTARNYSGGLLQGSGITNPATLQIPASNQKALRAVEIFDSGISDDVGWVELVASTPAVRGFFLIFDSQLSFVDGTALISEPSDRLIFPNITASTILSFVHTGTNTIGASVALYGDNGQLFTRQAMSVAPLSGFSGTVGDLVPGASGFEGSAVVETGSPFGTSATLVGVESFRNRSDVAMVKAFSKSDQLRTAYVEHIVSQGEYESTLTLVNPESVPQTVSIGAQALEVNGLSRDPSSETVQRTIPPQGRIVESVAGLFHLSGSDLITGYIYYAVDKDASGLFGYLTIRITFPLQLRLDPGTQLPMLFYNPSTGQYAPSGFIAMTDEAGRNASAEVMKLSTYVVGIPQDLILPVSSLNPVSGVPGTEVTISGSGFSTNATDNLVTFSGPGNTSLLATVIAATATSLSVKVPFGAVTGSVMVRVGPKSSFAMTYSVPGVSNPSPGGGTSNSIQLRFLGGGAGGGGTNQPPTVNAGPNQTITWPAPANLNGTATDDGLPVGSTLTTTWSKVSGPGAVIFGNANARTTTANFCGIGAFVLRLTATDGLLTSTGDLVVMVNPPAGGGPAYYVDTLNGDDCNSGVSSAPWKTIQRAADTIGPGATVNVGAGTYTDRVQITKSGSAGNLITFQARGPVVMQGFNIQASYIKVDGFEITNVPGKDALNRATSSGVYLSGSWNEVSNNYIHGTNAAGIYVTIDASNGTLRSNRVVSAVEAGIYVQGSNHLIVSNDISHTVQRHPGAIGADDADGIRFFGMGSTFRKNYIHDITLADDGNSNPHIDAFQTWGPCSNMIIEQNMILQMESPDQGITIEAVSRPVGNITIRNNTFMTNGTGYAPAVLAGDSGPVTNVNIVNNTMVALNGPTDFAIWLFPTLTTAVVKNNAIYDHGNSGEPYIRVDAGASGLDIGFNSISKSNGQAPIGSAYPGDLWMVNPLFVNLASRDFHLQSTSPLIDKGTTLFYSHE